MRFSVAGKEMDYEVRGEGRPVVLVHGLATDRRLLVEGFEPALDRPGVRRIYVDLPGHGASEANPACASADGLVAALRAFVLEVAGERPAIVAHSYGAYLALGLLLDVPTVEALFLASPIVQPDLGMRTLPPPRVSRVDEGLAFRDAEERETFAAEIALQTAPVLERFRRVLDPAHRATDRGFLAAVRARYAQSRPLSEALRRFGGPVAVVCGRDDYWSGYADALHILDAAVRYDFTVLSGCGHFLPIERPEALDRLVSDWLASWGKESPASTY